MASFQDVIHSGLETIMPAKPVKICTADVPSMNESLKSITKRQKAFRADGPDSAQFRYFRTLVNREKKTCRRKYYDSKGAYHLAKTSGNFGVRSNGKAIFGKSFQKSWTTSRGSPLFPFGTEFGKFPYHLQESHCFHALSCDFCVVLNVF